MATSTFRVLFALMLIGFVQSSLLGEIINTIMGTYSSPKYSVLKKTETYELREYEASNWVATSNGDKDADQLFMRLFRYIAGSNAAKSKIPMTVPVANKFAPVEGGAANMTMQFFLTTNDSPKPTDPKVFLTSYPAFKAYVRYYSGFTSDAKQKENLEALKKDIGANSYHVDYYFVCGYDAPWKFWNRRNEIWLFAN